MEWCFTAELMTLAVMGTAVPSMSILFSENKTGLWLGGRARALRV